MEVNTTKSIDSGNNGNSNELKVEIVKNKMLSHQVAIAMTMFEPRDKDKTLDDTLTSDDIMGGRPANRKNSKIAYVKSAVVRFKQFINEILNGISISLKGKSKTRTSTQTKTKTPKVKDNSVDDMNKE